MKEGIYNNMSEAEYHADPCIMPSLSSSIAKVIYSKSPAHAYLKHPRLNPNYAPDSNDTYDVGKVAHAMLLEDSEASLVIVEANDWRTNAAKEAREQAKASGKIPLLRKQAEEVMKMVDVARSSLRNSELFELIQSGNAHAEQTMIDVVDGVWMRARVDMISADRKIILDYKTTGNSAKPDAFARGAMINFGYDIQAAMYLMLNERLTHHSDTKFVWLVQECEPPYACSLIGAGLSVLDVGRMKLDVAISRWKECMRSGDWPGYGARIAWVDCPSYEIAKAIEASEAELGSFND